MSYAEETLLGFLLLLLSPSVRLRTRTRSPYPAEPWHRPSGRWVVLERTYYAYRTSGTLGGLQSAVACRSYTPNLTAVRILIAGGRCFLTALLRRQCQCKVSMVRYIRYRLQHLIKTTK